MKLVSLAALLICGLEAVAAQDIMLRTYNGHLVRALNGGGADVDARIRESRIGALLRLVDLNGPPLRSGDVVAIQACDGLFFTALWGGGGPIVATGPWIHGWEQFQVVSGVQNRALRNGDLIGLRTSTGHYVCAENGGGSTVVANRTAWLGWETFKLEMQPPPMVEFRFDSQRVSRINKAGRNILTGGGIYLIGSFTGADIPETNCSSIGGRNGRMTNGGPPYTLSFRSVGQNRLQFRAVVGPVPRRMEALSMAVDLQKSAVARWGFTGQEYRFFGAARYRDGSSGRYDEIPQPGIIRNANGTVLGRVGVAFTRGVPQTLVARGDQLRVRVDVSEAIGVRNGAFTHHFATHNIGFDMGPVEAGDRRVIAGTITILDP